MSDAAGRQKGHVPHSRRRSVPPGSCPLCWIWIWGPGGPYVACRFGLCLPSHRLKIRLRTDEPSRLSSVWGRFGLGFIQMPMSTEACQPAPSDLTGPPISRHFKKHASNVMDDINSHRCFSSNLDLDHRGTDTLATGRPPPACTPPTPIRIEDSASVRGAEAWPKTVCGVSSPQKPAIVLHTPSPSPSTTKTTAQHHHVHL